MAEFRIDQPGGAGMGTAGVARVDLQPGHVIELHATSPAPGAGITYTWEILDKVACNASLTATTGSSVNIGTLGADITAPAAFLVRLTANDHGTISTVDRVVAVRSTYAAIRPPVFGEDAPQSQRIGSYDATKSKDNAVYANRAGLGASGQNPFGWREWAWELVKAIEQNAHDVANIPPPADRHLVYDPLGTPSVNVFTTPASLVAAIPTFEGPVFVDLKANLTVPTAPYSWPNIEFHGKQTGGARTVLNLGGATITAGRVIVKSCDVTWTNLTNAPIVLTSTAEGRFDLVDCTAAPSGGSTQPLAQVDASSYGFMILDDVTATGPIAVVAALGTLHVMHKTRVSITGTAYTGAGTTVLYDEMTASSSSYVDTAAPVLGVSTTQDAVDQTKARFDVMQEPSGFPATGKPTLTFTDGTRTLALAPSVGGSYDVYVKGRKFTKTSDSVNWTNVEGVHVFYYNASGVLSHDDTGLSYLPTVLAAGYAVVSLIYWDATNGASIYRADERHGLTMDNVTHAHLHISLGTQWISGLALGPTVDQDGSLAAHAEISVTNGVIRDEDLSFSITSGSPQVLSLPAQIPVLYRSGVSGYWRMKAASNYPFIEPGTPGYAGTLPAYNQYTGGSWQLTPLTNNDYFLAHIFATNDIRYPILAVAGNARYSGVSSARTGALTEISTLLVQDIFAEFKALGSIIYQTSSSYTNASKARARSTSDGGSYVDFRTRQASTAGPAVTVHANLVGLDADDHTQYILAAGTRAFSGDQSMGGHKLTDLGTPTQSTDAATKGYVDALPPAMIKIYFSPGDPSPPAGVLTTWAQVAAEITATRLLYPGFGVAVVLDGSSTGYVIDVTAGAYDWERVTFESDFHTLNFKTGAVVTSFTGVVFKNTQLTTDATTGASPFTAYLNPQTSVITFDGGGMYDSGPGYIPVVRSASGTGGLYINLYNAAGFYQSGATASSVLDANGGQVYLYLDTNTYVENRTISSSNAGSRIDLLYISASSDSGSTRSTAAFEASHPLWTLGTITSANTAEASKVKFAATGNVSSTNVQSAIAELDSEKVAGPAASTDRAIATYNGTGGKTVFDNPLAVINSSGQLGLNVSPAYRLDVASGAAGTAAVARFASNDGTAKLFTYNATPEAAITGAPGDLCLDTTNGKLYIKNTGTGNTGWVEAGSGAGGIYRISVGKYTIVTGQTGVEVVVGGFAFDPTTETTIKLEALGNFSGNASVLLYEVGNTVSGGTAPVLRSTLTLTMTNNYGYGVKTLTPSASPGTNADQISTAETWYEIRINATTTGVLLGAGLKFGASGS